MLLTVRWSLRRKKRLMRSQTIKKLKYKKLGILISDHNVRETMQICDNVLIMSEGKAIAEGTPSKVSSNALVKEVYLGKDF